MNKKQAVQKEAVDTLKQWGVVDGTTVYAKVNSVSKSGMSRNISLYIISKNSGEYADRFGTHEMKDISYHAARALEWGYNDGYNGGIRVTGCGMDMLFATISALSHAMGYGSLAQSHDDTTGLRYRSL